MRREWTIAPPRAARLLRGRGGFGLGLGRDSEGTGLDASRLGRDLAGSRLLPRMRRAGVVQAAGAGLLLRIRWRGVEKDLAGAGERGTGLACIVGGTESPRAGRDLFSDGSSRSLSCRCSRSRYNLGSN